MLTMQLIALSVFTVASWWTVFVFEPRADAARMERIEQEEAVEAEKVDENP